MNHFNRAAGLLFLLLALFVPPVVMGQVTGITGRVADPLGAVIPKASITLHNVQTNQNLTTVSTATGDFTFTRIRPGLYDVSATAPGFKMATESAIHLELDATVTVNLTLVVGSVMEKVTVRSDEVQLDKTHADRGLVFSQDEIEHSPFNSGNPMMLANTQPGVYFNGCVSCGWVRPFDNGAINQFSTNGQGSDTNDFQLDGSPNNANSFGSRDIGYVPPTASIQEMKFVSNPYDAQYGHTGGGIFDIVTKYGGNTLHGQVYENARRTWLDANTHFNDNPVIGLAKTSDNRDQYGFELDGPVVIPHFYNGHDKTFFEVQYEGYRQNTPNSGIDSVPALSPGSTTQTVAQTGDFSADYYFDGGCQCNKPVTIYDPQSLPAQQSTTIPWYNIQRSAFPNNKIPTSRLNPTSLALLSYLPLPNRPTPSTLNFGMQNYAWQNTGTDRFTNVVARLDHNFGDKDRTYIRFAWNKRSQDANTNGIPGPAASGVFPLVRQNHFFTTDWAHTFNANSLFDLHLSFTRYAYAQNQGITPFNLANVGLGGLTSQVTASVFPQINMNTYTVFGGAAGNGGNKLTISNTIAAMPMWTYVHGAHTLKAGLDYRWMHASSYIGGASSGSFYVDSEWTQQQPWIWYGQQGGDSVASFALGTMDSGSIFTAAKQYFSYPYFAPFIQDDWKITHKLTVNLGLRWDLQGPPSEANNKIVGDFDTTSANPVQSQINASLLPAGTVLRGGNTYAGVNGKPRTVFGWDFLALQPRLGFAYALDNKTVVRGGIGTSYEAITGQGNSQGFSQGTSYTSSVTNGYLPDANTLTNPFPTIAKPAGASLGLLNSLGDSFGVSNRNFRLPGVLNYSLGVERQIGEHTTVDLSYVGSTGYDLDTADNINHISASYAASCNLEMGATATTYGNCINPGSNSKWVTNPFQNVQGFSAAATGNGNGYYTSSQLSASVFTRPFPEFGDITQTEHNDGKTRYDSAQIVVSHRWNNALTVHGSYVWSKTMDSGALNDDIYRIRQHYLDLGNRPWRYTANAVWHVPVGRGHKYLGNANRLVDTAIGGWVISPIYYYEGGTPAAIPSNLEVTHKQTYGVHRTVENGTHLIRAAGHCVGWYDPNSNFQLGPVEGQDMTACSTGYYDFIVRPSYGAVTNVPFPGVRNPNGQQLDLSVSKSIPVWERTNLEVRFEGYNVLNHPSWQGHGYWWSPSDPHFGTINMTYDSQTNNARQVQLSAKVMW